MGVGLAGTWVCYAFGNFLLYSPKMSLVHPEQVEISGNHYVSRKSVLEIFAADRHRSVLRIPLEARRREIESLPWVEQAVVRRALPNKIEVDIAERAPIAYLRQGSDLSLVDAHGVILDAPVRGDFHFPVVTGLTPEMSADDRERRMALFAGFSQQVESARSGAMDQVSEVDVSDVDDLRARIAGLQGGGAASVPLLVHFGDSDFRAKYLNLLDNVGKWRAAAGRLASVDLRFDGEAIANPDAGAAVHQRAAQTQSAMNVPAMRVYKKRAIRKHAR
ncbi:MAG: cell division protein FtsQ/DivIB [Candidatus Acidiferrales bacterium]